MSGGQEVTRLGAVELAQCIRGGKLGAAEVLQAHLAAIAHHNPAVNAICTLAAEQAMQVAQGIDEAIARGEDPGPLAGVPVGIKDVTLTEGIRTTFGSRLYADYVPREDAEVVARLRAAGAVIVGKTNTPEFAAGANTVNAVFGATRNPWDLRLSASGSTGGGAAALACGMIALAEGTDFGGSLRTPAAFCGVVGLRTTAGLVPKHPSVLPWHDQSVEGPMARSAADCALMLDAMTGLSANSPLSCVPPWKSALAIVQATESLAGVRLAWCPDIAGIGVDPEIERVCRAAADGLVQAGATVEHVSFDLSDGRDAFLALRAQAMVGTHWDRLDKLDQINPNLAGNIRAGLEVGIRDIAAAERKRAAVWHRWCVLFEKFDLLLSPTTPVPPFPVEQNFPDEVSGRKLGSYVDWIAPTFLVSLATLPAASVPAGRTASGLPVGLQIVGPRFAEPRILAAAKIVERMRPIGWPADRTP